MKFYNYTWFVYMIGCKMTLTPVSYVGFLGFTQWAISPSECPGLFIWPWKRLKRLMFRKAIFYFVIYWYCITDPVSPRVWSRGFIYLDWFDSFNGLVMCRVRNTLNFLIFTKKSCVKWELFKYGRIWPAMLYIYKRLYLNFTKFENA